MNDTVVKLTAGLQKNPPATENLIRQVEEQLGFSFPADYREFISHFNGASGPVGTTSYLQLWPVEDIPKLNQTAHVAKIAPGLVLFGSDGGITSYAFDNRRPDNIVVVEIPDYPFALDQTQVLGQTFSQFLEKLFNRL